MPALRKPFICLVPLFSLLASPALAQVDPQVEACQATGLVALKEKNPDIKNVYLDPDSLTISKADTKIEDTAIRTIIIGDSYLEEGRKDKPHQFLCIIGEKGKVLLTFFTQQ